MNKQTLVKTDFDAIRGIMATFNQQNFKQLQNATAELEKMFGPIRAAALEFDKAILPIKKAALEFQRTTAPIAAALSASINAHQAIIEPSIVALSQELSRQQKAFLPEYQNAMTTFAEWGKQIQNSIVPHIPAISDWAEKLAVSNYNPQEELVGIWNKYEAREQQTTVLQQPLTYQAIETLLTSFDEKQSTQAKKYFWLGVIISLLTQNPSTYLDMLRTIKRTLFHPPRILMLERPKASKREAPTLPPPKPQPPCLI